MRRALWTLTVVVAIGACALAAEWPQFLGPDCTGVSPETGLAKTWPADGPKELWQAPVSTGFGGASIEGGKVFFMDRTGDTETVKCVDAATGKEDWKLDYEAPPAKKFDFPGSRAMPTVDAKSVYTVGAAGDIYCIDKKAGTKVWNKHLLNDFGGKLPQWAVSSAPVLYKDWVIVAPQSKTVGLAALEKATGKVAWQGEPIGSAAYCTPLIAKIGDVEQAVMLNHTGLYGVSLADGKKLWSLPMGNKDTIKDADSWFCGIPIPGPTDLGGGKFFVTGGYKGGSVFVQVSKDGAAFKAAITKKVPDVGTHIHNAVLYKGNLFVNSGDCGVNAENKSLNLVCLDLDGNIKWKTAGTPDLEKGNLVIADGLIFVQDGADGTIRLVAATPEAYKELGVFKGLGNPRGKGSQELWAPLSVGEGKLIGRDKKKVVCWDISAGK